MDDGRVADSLTYYAALNVLGTRDSRLVRVLDAAAMAGLGAWAAGSVASGRDQGPALDLLEVKDEVMRCAQGAVRRVSEWRSGLGRLTGPSGWPRMPSWSWRPISRPWTTRTCRFR
jgi:hypothetical protein